jgi:hypothetical protein
MTLIATASLTAAVLFRSPSDFRIGVCIIVSAAATPLAVRSLFTDKLVWTLLFLGVLGIFTPFHRTQFSHLLISIIDMATLALLAASPISWENGLVRWCLSTLQGKCDHPALAVEMTGVL